MAKLTTDQKKEIVQALTSKGVKAICPMCGNNQFAIADGYFNNLLNESLESFRIGGPSIPSIPIVCKRCGFISQHSLGVLGLLPEKKEETKDGKKEK